MQDVACPVKNGTTGSQWSVQDSPDQPSGGSQRNESTKSVGEGGLVTSGFTEDGTDMIGGSKQLQANDASSLASTVKSFSELNIGKSSQPESNVAALNSFLALAGGVTWQQSPSTSMESESSGSPYPGLSVGAGTRHADPSQGRYNPQWHSSGPQVVGYTPRAQYANPRRTYTHGWGGDAVSSHVGWSAVGAHSGMSPNTRAGSAQVGRCLPGNQMGFVQHGRRVTNYPGFNAQGGRGFSSQEDDHSTEDLKTLLGLSQDQGHFRGYEMPKVNGGGGLDAQLLDLIRSQQDALNGNDTSAHGSGSNSWMTYQSDGRLANKNKPFVFSDIVSRTGPGPCVDGMQQLLLNRASIVGHMVNNAERVAASLGLQGGAIDRTECYSRKVFVGGLPPDIDEDEILSAFRRFGSLAVDWPHKAESKSYFPPKGYCFLLFQDELSVQSLVEACFMEDGKLFWYVSSPTTKDKPVQMRPWSLADSDFVMDNSQPIDPRKTVFVGGVPRPLKAVELAMIMGRLYGGVCYAGIDTDPELKYPKGAGRVAFSNQQSYIAAISARFVQLQHGDLDKRVEVKPYVLDDQICDECQGVHSGGKFAPFFCANVLCLQYYCERCWAVIHSSPGREFHKPLVKEGTDRPRPMPFHWS